MSYRSNSFRYTFITFFCLWWGLALFYLAAVITKPPVLFQDPDFVLGLIVIVIGLGSAVLGITERAMGPKRAIESQIPR